MARVALALVTALVGCTPDGPADVPLDLSDPTLPPVETAPPEPTGPDADDDLLSDDDEAVHGTDPQDPDSDDDGWLDGEEVWHHADPLSADDHPYAGGWRMGACRHDVQATGNDLGQVAEDFALTDQFGETLHLHDFCDRAVVIVSSAMWCGPCQAEADDLQAWFDAYRYRGLMVITLLGQDQDGLDAGPADQDLWVESFELEHPVVLDPGFRVTSRFVDGSEVALPSGHLLGPGLEVLERDGYVTEDEVLDALP